VVPVGDTQEVVNNTWLNDPDYHQLEALSRDLVTQAPTIFPQRSRWFRVRNPGIKTSGQWLSVSFSYQGTPYPGLAGEKEKWSGTVGLPGILKLLYRAKPEGNHLILELVREEGQ